MNSEIISVVGAGGKTTFIKDFAKNASKHKNILVSTTTKMRLPGIKDYNYIIMDKEEFEKNKELFLKYNTLCKNSKFNKDMILLKNRIVFIACKRDILFKGYLKKNNIYYKSLARQKEKKIFIRRGIYYYLKKISMTDKKFMHIQEEDIAYFKDKFDCILLESDGARGKRIKFPKEYEPVISHHTTKTVLILDILMTGKGIKKENIYNYKGFLQNISDSYLADKNKIHNNLISVEILYNMIMDEKGLFKNAKGQKILCINKLINKEDYNNAEKLKNMLKNTNIYVIYKKYDACTCL